MFSTVRRQKALSKRGHGTAPLRRPGAAAAINQNQINGSHMQREGIRLRTDVQHPLCKMGENADLLAYENAVKQAFEAIVPALKDVSSIQHEAGFEVNAQHIVYERLGFNLPEPILADAWVGQLDMRRLFAWCVFNTYKRFCDDFFSRHASSESAEKDFDLFLQSCGFHTLDITPCADGRLAHLVRYVLRLPARAVRRKSYAGAMFDVEDSLEKWMEIELQRFRAGVPNTVDAPTRYLKVVVYHFSTVNPDQEGCAAHGSDVQKAAQAGLERLSDFRQAVENSFCCGASIDLLLIGVNTDNDSMRVHVPDGRGQMELGRYIDTKTIFDQTAGMDPKDAKNAIELSIQRCSPDVPHGMVRLIAYLIENNLSQIAYVLGGYGQQYPDIGHAEKFIGAGVGFEDIQLRNLMYFAYLNTVEEGAADLDVGIKIFRALNVAHGLPVPVVVRFDYHGHVPGARVRAEQRCARVARALTERYASLFGQGMLHVLQVARDCDSDSPLEMLASTVSHPEMGSC